MVPSVSYDISFFKIQKILQKSSKSELRGKIIDRDLEYDLEIFSSNQL